MMIKRTDLNHMSHTLLNHIYSTGENNFFFQKKTTKVLLFKNDHKDAKKTNIKIGLKSFQIKCVQKIQTLSIRTA